jgi:C4-dicarboxylate-binding protein DctP
VVTSGEWWENLPDDVRNQLATILREVTEVRNSESTAVNELNKQNIIKAGGIVRTLTPEQRQQWVDALKPVWKKFEKDIGSDLIEAAQASNQ